MFFLEREKIDPENNLKEGKFSKKDDEIHLHLTLQMDRFRSKFAQPRSFVLKKTYIHLPATKKLKPRGEHQFAK